MDASLQTATTADIILLAIGPLVYVAAGAKILLAHRGQPFSRQSFPILFWVDLALFLSLLVLGLVGLASRDAGDPAFGLLFMSPGMAWTAGHWASAKSNEFVETSWRTASIRMMCLAIVIGLFAYADILDVI